MPIVKRQNPKAFEQLSAKLKELDGLELKVGWFESTRYEDGTPVAGIAAVQEYGANISHPGGTPYMIGEDGKAIFVSKDSPGAQHLPVTKPHQIVIPPRPFMRPTVDRERNNWINQLASAARAIARGALTGTQALDAFGSRVAGDIAKSIAAVTAPPLKPGTIAARKRSLTDKSTVGSLDKPLVHSGIMIDSLSHTVGKE